MEQKMGKIIDRKRMRMRIVLIFLITFLIAAVGMILLNRNQEKQEKLKAAYTAESTVSQVETRLNRYLAESELLKQIVENGYKIDQEEFSTLSGMMQDENGVIEAIEMAEGGTITQVYPLEGNEEALGLNMLENPERKQEARLAKRSGQYTIAGPFELVQGGTGVLLFDPVYMNEDKKEFWGFTLLVINWENFLKEIELDKLEDAGYHYQIWKKSPETNEKVVIAQCESEELKDTLEVACAVPNDTWYFEIVPAEGWITAVQKFFDSMIVLVLSILMTAGFWQFEVKEYRDAVHAQEIEKSAKAARAANEAKTRFLFNMSHDIRTPMNAIIGFSDLLEKHIDEKEKAIDYIGKIKSSSTFLLSLINYVLEMARIESGKATLKMEMESPKELIDSLLNVFEPSIQEKELNYRCISDIQHEYVIGDKTKVREIFLNVISNSIKYTPSGGSVTVTVTETPSARDGYADFTVVVEDTGIGMSEEYLPHIFEEFTREHTTTESKIVGAGLGLPIVKSLVDLMDGKIKVESKIGKGTKTTIELSFPIATEEEIQQGTEKKREEIIENLHGKRILLAEDNDLNAEIAMTILQENGFDVNRVEDGIMCVAELQKKSAKYYDLILMDIQMPNMDGYQAAEVIRNLKNERADIPIVAMTANAFEEDRKKAFAAGMNGHIAKPIDVNVLFSTLENMLMGS